ncbi:MAG: GntR family transcriptional regulator [Gammaproteobacteria bacterium]|nr:GntR family transcriptional regulator [Gammaproteobacteria bacterium]
MPLSDFETTQNYAYLRLRNALMVGAISPGIAITIQDISESLEVSATPVREALRQLCSENALQSLKNRRIMVPVMTPARLEELISLRCALEMYAAKRALPYINNMEIDNLERIDNQLDQAQSEENWSEMVLLNQRFHSGLYVANPNQVVMPMIESIWLQLGPFMGVAAKYQQEFYIVDHHKEAIAALRQNDPVILESAIEADIRDGVGQLNPEKLQSILPERQTK